MNVIIQSLVVFNCTLWTCSCLCRPMGHVYGQLEPTLCKI